MKKVLLGIVLGIIILILFVYLGGGEAIIRLGKGVEVAGERLKHYEGVLKGTTEKVKKGLEKQKERLYD
ncbi:MAG: hypothetical protein HY878_04555 [Deltaproteobacteria bacterium]|nr:hypothetical protein [Deltaproteobacteria bacterium]